MVIVFAVKFLSGFNFYNILAPIALCKTAVVKLVICDVYLVCSARLKPKFAVAFKENCNSRGVEIIVLYFNLALGCNKYTAGTVIADVVIFKNKVEINKTCKEILGQFGYLKN